MTYEFELYGHEEEHFKIVLAYFGRVIRGWHDFWDPVEANHTLVCRLRLPFVELSLAGFSSCQAGEKHS